MSDKRTISELVEELRKESENFIAAMKHAADAMKHAADVMKHAADVMANSSGGPELLCYPKNGCPPDVTLH